MSACWKVARAELSFLTRSKLAVVSATIFTVCLIFATLSSRLFLEQDHRHRLSHQEQANDIFESQPDRHPHRMVHYGHYVFRTPPPLAAVDPGLDAYGGTAIFLEGHRQNAAMFAGATEGIALTRFGSFTPAFVLQVFAPLLLILLGHATFTREREAGTLMTLLAQGVSLRAIASGKVFILICVVGLCLVPLVVVGLSAAASRSEGIASSVALVISYGLYLSIWAMAVVCVSLWARRGAAAFLVLCSIWLVTAVILPRLAADVAAQIAPLKSAIERDMEVQSALRELGDSHDPNDPAYAAFQAKVLDQYGVERIDDLPVNFKGLLAVEGEQQSAQVMAQFNVADVAARNTQRNWISSASILSPMVAVHNASQSLAGTDLHAYHAFLRAAEDHRLAFVQELNMLQATAVDYKYDKIRSKDLQTEKATRVSADAWAKLPRFAYTAATPAKRLRTASPYGSVLLLWFAVVGLCFFTMTRQARP